MRVPRYVLGNGCFIRGVVNIYPGDTPDSEWKTDILWNNNAELSNTELVSLAIQKFKAAYQDDTDWDARVFVLGKLHETSFEKDTPGGMRGKRYFHVDDDKLESAEKVAEQLKGKVWSNYSN